MKQGNEVINLLIKLDDNALVVKSLKKSEGQAPSGEKTPEAPVPNSVIGYWVDVTDDQGLVLYRRFIHNKLPFNFQEECRKWSKRRRQRTRIEIQLPALSNAKVVRLYEQSLKHCEQREPDRRCHMELDLAS